MFHCVRFFKKKRPARCAERLCDGCTRCVHLFCQDEFTCHGVAVLERDAHGVGAFSEVGEVLRVWFNGFYASQ